MLSMQMAIRQGRPATSVVRLSRGILARYAAAALDPTSITTTRMKRSFLYDAKDTATHFHSEDDHFSHPGEARHQLPPQYTIPKRTEQKLIRAEDAVALIRDGDTVAVSGFVTQGSPEAVLKALGERFANTASPSNLTLLFGGGPGDYGERGLSHLAKEKDGKRYDKFQKQFFSEINVCFGRIRFTLLFMSTPSLSYIFVNYCCLDSVGYVRVINNFFEAC
jgi:hypothetical protein